MIQIPQEQLEQRWDESPDEIRDAIFSDTNNNALDEIAKAHEFNEGQQKNLAYLCLIAFLGFISTKDTFEQLKDFFGGNTKDAYDVYTILDQKLFNPIRGSIESFYKVHREVQFPDAKAEVPRIEAEVNLKKEPAKGAVNLKTETIQKVESQPGPVIIPAISTGEPLRQSFSPSLGEVGSEVSKAQGTGQQIQKEIQRPRLFTPHDFHMRNEQRIGTRDKAQEIRQEAIPNIQTSIPPTSYVPSPTLQPQDTGPVILHKKEESIPIAQTTRFKEYKSISPGGFLGSFGSLFSRKQETGQAPRASVQIPEIGISDKGQGESEQPGTQVPIRVKNFGEGQKAVHYKDYRTYLDSRDEA